MLRLHSMMLTVLSLGALLAAVTPSSAQFGPGQNGPLWNRSTPSNNYRGNVYAPAQAAPAVTAPATTTESFYNGAIDNRSVRLRLRVPADARVWFDNTATMQTGENREYVSPPLAAGQNFQYQLRIQSSTGEQTRNVTVRAGDRIDLDFTNPAR